MSIETMNKNVTNKKRSGGDGDRDGGRSTADRRTRSRSCPDGDRPMPRPSVSFCPKVRCRLYLHRNDMTVQERHDAYFQPYDYDRMVHDTLLLVQISTRRVCLKELSPTPVGRDRITEGRVQTDSACFIGETVPIEPDDDE